ncbi:T9SS type A sorting domain-containing protein [Ekhidna sp.]|uniref:T9SS type A sorting domain-containing protein n=1 Tax=Ekhidna sp. TaxID=2608089 RepID=UPI00351643AF
MRRLTTIISSLLGAGVFLVFITIGGSDQKITEYQKYIEEKISLKKNGHTKSTAPDIHALIQKDLRTRHGQEHPEYAPNQVLDEYYKAKNVRKQLRLANEDWNFVERGPGNVAGRTRAIIVDPDDVTDNTWFAGSASGGIWKTTDGGFNWTFISEDIPNLGTNTLAMSPANPNVIYAGTGEHFTNDIDGSGLFKTNDKGVTWVQIASPGDFPDFKNISRIAVNPNDEDELVVTSRNSVWEGGLQSAIYKSLDGGATWTKLRESTFERYDDIAVDPNDFNTLYVAIRSQGVIKSTNGGITWFDASNGMYPSGRVEIAISKVNPSRLWASVEGGLSGTNSDLYVTSDGATSWNIAINGFGGNEDFLGGQGWYDNYVTPHPFNEDIVYVGGVNNWKFELSGGSSNVTAVSASDNGTTSFISYINFGGDYYGGAIDKYDAIADQDLKSVEIRFGQGSQLAHRFTVGGHGSGADPSQYIYQDYIEVPFQVWDTDNNNQLMVSFRDQQENQEWDLISFNTSGDGTTHSREYVFIHNVPYSEFADGSIASVGGFEHQQMYNFWPTLSSEMATFDPTDLPYSNLSVTVNDVAGLERITTSVSDAYRQFGGPNSFPQSGRDEGIHPDQHFSMIINENPSTQEFGFLITNDGGVYKSVTSSDPGTTDGDFEYVSFGYNTTQFYSADKAPDSYRFVGGMQDNGTWYNQVGTEGSASANAIFAIGGDGFESLWHSVNRNKIIGGSQYNNFVRTTDGGQTWQNASSGYDDNGPFITRLAHHKSKPERIFTVGEQGVWISQSFGESWSACSMSSPELWSFTNSADVEVSYSNEDIVWAGGRMTDTQRLFISTNGGATFAPANNYDSFEMGSVSGIATHPVDDNTAFVLFSFAGYPKVLKTTNLGQSWIDISGFDGSGDRGFPDVAVNTLFVFPHDNNQIWVGSEIGIIESLDGGKSWHLLESDFPAVNTYDFKLSENTLVIATYGRGIWSVDIPATTLSADESSRKLVNIFPNPIENLATISFDKKAPNQINVVDLNGKIVDHISPDHRSNTIEYRPNLKSGLYFLHFDLDNRKHVKKIIIK